MLAWHSFKGITRTMRDDLREDGLRLVTEYLEGSVVTMGGELGSAC